VAIEEASHSLAKDICQPLGTLPELILGSTQSQRASGREDVHIGMLDKQMINCTVANALNTGLPWVPFCSSQL